MKDSRLTWKEYQIYLGGHMSRRIKKKALGRKLNKTKLKKLIASVKIVKHDLFDFEILPFPFCPKCGCTAIRSTGNMAHYPELWEILRCGRCNSVVSEADNSRYIHVLEEIKGEN